MTNIIKSLIAAMVGLMVSAYGVTLLPGADFSLETLEWGRRSRSDYTMLLMVFGFAALMFFYAWRCWLHRRPADPKILAMLDELDE
ncbi:hypothetical protein [Lysobacter sp. HA35]